MSLRREKLSTVNGLNLSIANEMSNDQFDEYCKALFAFSEIFPSQEAELKNSLNAKDYDAFSKTLLSVCDALEKIQATGMAQSCRKLLDELSSKKYNIVEAHLTYLLAEISGLSIAIQTAKHDNEIMSLSKEKLLTVNGLNCTIINEMSDDQYCEYCKTLFAFTETFPSQEAELKNSFSAKDYDVFSKVLLGVRDMLEKFQATGLAHSCRRLLDELGTQKYNIVEAHLTYLLAEISGLSIDIQMIQHDGETPKKAEVKVEPTVADEENTVETSQKNILAVDDVSFLLMGLKSILKNTGYKVIGVTSGEDALKYIEKHNPDLFILDIEMPEMNGYELAEELRQRGQTGPIIFLTGNATREYVRKAIEVGAADFIVKPVNKEQVLEKIRKYIG